jgi:hypothetical protein
MTLCATACGAFPCRGTDTGMQWARSDARYPFDHG